MSTSLKSPTEVQLEMMSALLEGEDPEAWVILPVGALVTEIRVVLAETVDKRGHNEPGRTSTRLIKNLFTNGWIKDSKYQQVSHR